VKARSKLRRAGLASFASLLLLAGGAGAARAERAPAEGEGWHPVRHEAYVDLGAFVDCVTWRYVVKENETLGEIAQRELGTSRRHREILALNPGLTPRKLRAQSRIVMPPRSAACHGRGPKYVFFAWTPDAQGWAAPRQLRDGAVHRVSHGARLYAVPAARLQAILGKATETGLDGRVLEEEPDVARSGVVNLVGALPDTDPTWKLVTRWKITGVEDGYVNLARLGEERYDVAGELLASSAGGGSRPTTALLVLSFLLMVAGLGLSVARAQRPRTPVPTPEPVVDPAPAAGEAAADGEAYEDDDDFDDEDEDEDEEEDDDYDDEDD